MKCIRVRWLIESGRLSPLSPIALICMRLKVEWLPYMHRYVYGPTPGITEVLERVLDALKPKSMLDLYCGSGALSKLAYIKNVEKIKAVDIYVEAAKKNLKKLKRVEIEEGDALKFDGGRYDLVVADPPEEEIKNLIRKLREFKKKYVKAMVIWLGPYHKASKIIKTLSRDRKCIIVEAWGDAVGILWKKSEHKEAIRKALRNTEFS